MTALLSVLLALTVFGWLREARAHDRTRRALRYMDEIAERALNLAERSIAYARNPRHFDPRDEYLSPLTLGASATGHNRKDA